MVVLTSLLKLKDFEGIRITNVVVQLMEGLGLKILVIDLQISIKVLTTNMHMVMDCLKLKIFCLKRLMSLAVLTLRGLQ